MSNGLSDNLSVLIGLLTTWGVVLAKLLIATLCGGAIGYERERYDHPAGLRTHVLVCVGAAVYMLVSVAVAGAQYDPGRIAAQVASGIGFLGAGTIIKQGNIVRGLTTAASLWAVAGIGLAVGYNFITLAIALLGTIVVVATLYGLKALEYRIQHRRAFALHVTLNDPREQTQWVRQVLEAEGIEVNALTYPPESTKPGEVTLQGYVPTHGMLDNALAIISANDAVLALRWEYR